MIRAMTPDIKKTEDQRRRGDRFLLFLEREIWSKIPSERLGRPLSRAEEDEILGYGPDGV